eukprot:4992990-Ditylum_brightwellii.AAC.1
MQSNNQLADQGAGTLQRKAQPPNTPPRPPRQCSKCYHIQSNSQLGDQGPGTLQRKAQPFNTPPRLGVVELDTAKLRH